MNNEDKLMGLLRAKDNKEFSDIVSQIKDTDEKVSKALDEAFAFYTGLVERSETNSIKDGAIKKYILDSLLDYGDDLRFLELYRRLGKHIYRHHPEILGESSWAYCSLAHEGETQKDDGV